MRRAGAASPNGPALALPGRAAEALAPRHHGEAAAGELVHLLADLGADVGGQRGGGVLEQRNDIPRCGTVVEKATRLVPDQGALARVAPVAELEQGHFTARLPDEEVEIFVVEPAPLRWRVVGYAFDFFQH